MIRPTDPRPSFPDRESPSVRRVMYLDYDWIDLVDVRVRGEARDEVTDASGATHVERAASVDVETSGGLLTKLVLEPAELDVTDLLGQPLRQGFRSRLRPVHDGGGRPLGLLLDDLPGAMIAAGYVHAMERTIGPGTTLSDVDGDEMPRSFQQADLCSGWRSDGTMMIAVYAGEPLPFEPTRRACRRCPTARAVGPRSRSPCPGCGATAGSTSFPTARCGGSTRGSATRIGTPTASAARCTSTRCVPSPMPPTTRCSRSARFRTHCRGRSARRRARWSASSSGTELDGLRSSVPKVLRGIESCTHLTNELRELADVPLPRRVARARVMAPDETPPRFPGQRVPAARRGWSEQRRRSPHACSISKSSTATCSAPQNPPQTLPASSLRRAGGRAGRARREPHGAGRALPPLVARLLPPVRAVRSADHPPRRPRSRRRIVLGPARERAPER